MAKKNETGSTVTVLDRPALNSDPVIDDAAYAATVNHAEGAMNLEEVSSNDVFTLEDGTPIELSGIKNNEASKVVLVPFEKLWRDPTANIRRNDATNYDPSVVKHLRNNLNKYGQTTPIRASKQADGRLLVVQGNMRHYAMSLDRAEYRNLQANDPIAYPESGMPWQKVKVDIKVGLTRQEERILMLDHGREKELFPDEMYNGVKELVGYGWSEKAVMNHLGWTRGNVTVHFKAAKLKDLNPDVERNYLAYLTRKKGDKVMKMDKPAIDKMYSGMLADLDPKTGDTDTWPNFNEAWKTVQKTLDEPGTKTKAPKETLEAQLVIGVTDPMKNHPLLKDFVKHMLNMEVKSPLNHVRDNIVSALHTVYPVEKPEPKAVTTVIEGNVTREV